MNRTSRAVLASSGMQADALTLQKNLKARMVWYEHQTGKEMVFSLTRIAESSLICL